MSIETDLTRIADALEIIAKGLTAPNQPQYKAVPFLTEPPATTTGVTPAKVKVKKV